MLISKRILLGLLVATAAAAGLASAVTALGSGEKDDAGHGHGTRGHALAASLAPSLPDDPALHGVAPGSAPWVLDRGKVRIERRGRFELRVRGLVIPTAPANGTPGPVTTISASLFCGADSVTTPVDTTDQAPLSGEGDGRVRDASFGVPASCIAPVVLVHPNGNEARYIAASGWR